MTAPQQQVNTNGEPLDLLTQKEVEVMLYYANPFLDKREIAAKLCISLYTLNQHISSSFSKLGETDRFAASYRFLWFYPQYKKRVEGEIEKSIQEAA